MIRLPGETIPYGILFVTVGTDSDMIVTWLILEVGARVRYLLHPGAEACAYINIHFKVWSGN